MKQNDLLAAARHCWRMVGCSGCPLDGIEMCQEKMLGGLADALENKQREIDALRAAKAARDMEGPS